MKRSNSRSLPHLLESLESRTLLSATVHPLILSRSAHHTAAKTKTVSTGSPTPTPTPTPVLATGTGVNLNLTAGVSFTGEVAFFPSPVLDPPGFYGASINWGDGSSSQGTLQYTTQNNVGGYEIIGTHTYNNTGNFKIVTTVTEGFIFPGGASPALLRLVAIIDSTATVTGSTTGGGVTINETSGKSFTTTVGTFNFPAPGTGLKATIDWGDGKTSVGVIQPIGVIGLDVINFAVVGTHTYTTPGTYPITITVTKPAPSTTSIPTFLITTIDSTAIVTAPVSTSLAGTLTGSYKKLLTPSVGSVYQFTGSGTLDTVGDVTVTGSVHLAGPITATAAATAASGTLTLTNSSGTVTLQVIGPIQPSLTTFPSTLTYKVTAGTGAYANLTSTGAITVTLIPAATPSTTNSGGFTFVLS